VGLPPLKPGIKVAQWTLDQCWVLGEDGSPQEAGARKVERSGVRLARVGVPCAAAESDAVVAFQTSAGGYEHAETPTAAALEAPWEADMRRNAHASYIVAAGICVFAVRDARGRGPPGGVGPGAETQ
jgi:hypothetical protein